MRKQRHAGRKRRGLRRRRGNAWKKSLLRRKQNRKNRLKGRENVIVKLMNAWLKEILAVMEGIHEIAMVEEIVMVVVAAAVAGDHEEWILKMNLVPCVTHLAETTVKAVLKALRRGGLVVELGVTRKRRKWMLGVLVREMMIMTEEEMTMKMRDLIVVTVVIRTSGKMNQWSVTGVLETLEEMNL